MSGCLITTKLQDADARAMVIARGRVATESKLDVLNDNMPGDGRAYICGSEMILADYFGSGILSVGEITGCGFVGWPKVQA